MKNKAFKEILKYVRVIVFFAVITILVEAVNYVMVQPGYARYIIHTVDNPDDGSDYDCIVVGASHGRASIDRFPLAKPLKVMLFCNKESRKGVTPSFSLL